MRREGPPRLGEWKKRSNRKTKFKNAMRRWSPRKKKPPARKEVEFSVDTDSVVVRVQSVDRMAYGRQDPEPPAPNPCRCMACRSGAAKTDDRAGGRTRSASYDDAYDADQTTPRRDGRVRVANSKQFAAKMQRAQNALGLSDKETRQICQAYTNQLQLYDVYLRPNTDSSAQPTRTPTPTSSSTQWESSGSETG